MSERLQAVAASGLPENRQSTPTKTSKIIRGAAFVLLPLAVIAACKSQEDVSLRDCPEGVYTNAAGSTDGFAPNSVILLSKGGRIHEDVETVLDKYNACRDTLHIVDIDDEVTSTPFVVKPADRDALLAELQSLVGEKLEGVHLDSGLQSNLYENSKLVC